jgi:proline iminopeptidase
MRSQTWLPLAALLALGACDPMDPGKSGYLVPRTVVEDPSLPAIEMNGVRFHVETRGDASKPAIVFLHGGPGGDYRSLLRMAEEFDGHRLTDDYFLIYWDQRGSGLSERVGKTTLTTDVFTNDLNTLIDRYSPARPVVLIGASWGGMLATQYINTHPERVAGAVLIEPGPLDGATFERIKDDINDVRMSKEWLNDYAWSSQFLSPDDHARMDYGRMLGLKGSQPRFHQRMEPDPEPSWRLGAFANRYLYEDGQENGKAVYDFTKNLTRYTTPVLFIAGGLSEILGESLQRTQVRKYPRAALYVVPNAGHDVNWTHTREVLSEIRPYLNIVRGVSR